MVLVPTASRPGGVGFLGRSGIEMSDALMGRCAGSSMRWFLVSRACWACAAAAGGCEIRFRGAGAEGRLTQRRRRGRDRKMVRV